MPLAALICAGIYFYGAVEVERRLGELHVRERLSLERGAAAMTGVLEGINGDLLFLSQHSALRDALESPTAKNIGHLAEDFVIFSRSKKVYDQVRWIDQTGMEIVRVDYANGHPVIVGGEQLQNKGKRYFFADSFKLNPGEIFVSPLDLNIENNQIEVPYKPMVRVATPVIDRQGQKRGIVILNYYGREMLSGFDAAVSAIRDHAMVLNGEGYWLKAPNPADEWGFMFKKADLSLAVRHPAVWERIRADGQGQAILGDGLWTWQTVHPLVAGLKSSHGAAEAFAPSRGEIEAGEYVWKIVAHMDGATLSAIRDGVWRMLLLLGLLLVVLSGFGCWRLAHAWVAQAEAESEVRRINAGLERLVKERTSDLNDRLAELDESHVRLASKNEEMESMIYIASHDLRSPLVNIQGFSQRLAKAAGDIQARLAKEDVSESVRQDLAKLLDERIPAALGFIRASSEKIDTLVGGMLRLSRAGRTQIEPKPLDMNAILHQVTATLATQLSESGAALSVEPLPVCQGDSGQVIQIFTNLIDNAIKYRDPTRPLEIRIRGEQDGLHVRYTVADNGLGIAAEAQGKVWQLFQRLDSTGLVAGEGVGLTIVRRMVERQGGEIALRSAPGEGSCFTVTLPIAVLPAPTFAEGPSS